MLDKVSKLRKQMILCVFSSFVCSNQFLEIKLSNDRACKYYLFTVSVNFNAYTGKIMQKIQNQLLCRTWTSFNK